MLPCRFSLKDRGSPVDNCIRIPIAAALSVLVVATAMADAPHSLILFVPDGPRARSINPRRRHRTHHRLGPPVTHAKLLALDGVATTIESLAYFSREVLLEHT